MNCISGIISGISVHCSTTQPFRYVIIKFFVIKVDNIGIKDYVGDNKINSTKMRPLMGAEPGPPGLVHQQKAS